MKWQKANVGGGTLTLKKESGFLTRRSRQLQLYFDDLFERAHVELGDSADAVL
jgi:hypothetical protein